MKKHLLSVLTGLLSLLLQTTTFAQTCTCNLLTNPGFEFVGGALTAWNPQGTVNTSTDAHTGTKAVEICAGGSGIAQTLPVQAGQTYTATFFGKKTGSPQAAYVWLRFLNSSWTPLESQPGSPQNVQTITSTTYQSYTVTNTAPTGAAYVQLFVWKEGAGCMLLDEFCLTTGGGNPSCQITAAASQPTCNDNGTPANPADDRFSFILTVTNPASSTGYGVFIPQTSQFFQGTYGSPLTIQNIPISMGNLTLNLTDDVTPGCSASVAVTPPAPCSGSGNPANLAISNVACPANYPDPTAPFTWNVTVQNDGGSASQPSPVYLYNFAPQAVGSVNQLLATATVPPLQAGQSTTVPITAPASTHSPNPGFAANGQQFLMTGTKGLSFTQVTSGNAPAFNETNGFPSIYCKKFSTDIAVDVSTSTPNVAPTQPLVFTVTVTNNGPVDAYNVTSGLYTTNSGTPFPPGFSAQLSTGLVWETNLPQGAGTTTKGRLWHIPFLAVGQSATATVTLTPVPGWSEWSSNGFTFTRTADSGHNMDTNAANNTDQVVFNGSGGPGQIDLWLTLEQLTANPAQWSNYSVKATLRNVGPLTATGVKVKFPKPTGVVYQGGNEYSSSPGIFTPFGDEVWTVGNLPANGTASLTVNYFLLNTSAPVAYAQVTAHNETDSDSQPNNGTPPTPVQDDEAATTGGGGPTPQPDLTIADLQIPTTSVAAGAILSYNFDAGNAGNAAVPGNFTIKSYISTDNVLSANDLQDGTIPTGNYGVGFSVQNVAGASAIPASLVAGTYFLIVKIDADNGVSESNENNNTVVKSFTVTGGGGGGNECGFLKSYNPEPTGDVGTTNVKRFGQETASGFKYVETSDNIFTNESRIVTTETDQAGNMTNFTDITFPTPAADEITATASGNNITVKRTTPTGGTVWTNTFPLNVTGTILGISTQSDELYPVTGGYFVTGTVVLQGPTSVLFRPFVIKIGTTGSLIQQNFLPDQPDIISAFDLRPSGDGGYYMQLFRPNFLQIFKTNGNGAFQWIQFTASDLPSTDVTAIVVALDGSAVYVAVTDNQNGRITKFAASDGTMLYQKLDRDIFSPGGPFTNQQVVGGMVPTLDGGLVFGFGFQSPGGDGSGFEYGKVDAAGNEVWSHIIASEWYFRAEKQTSDGGFLFIGDRNFEDFAMMKTTSEGELTPACGGGPVPMPDLTIQNASANVTSGQGGGFVLSYSLNLSNLGTVPVSNATLTYFISTDQVLSANDVSLGNVTGINLTAGQAFPAGASVPVPASIAPGAYFFIITTDPANLIVESVENNNQTALPITVPGTPGTGDCAAITITPGQNKITIAGFSAPHVLIKVFRPNWTVAFECLDGACANPLVVSGLSAGNHFVEIKLLNAGWGEICKKTQTVNVTSFTGGGSGNALKINTDRQRLAFDNIYPNPAKYLVTLDLYSAEEQETVLDFYDGTGRPVHRMEVLLNEGKNEVQVPVFDWKSGTYNVIARGDGLPAYGRFLKVWEE